MKQKRARKFFLRAAFSSKLKRKKGLALQFTSTDRRDVRVRESYSADAATPKMEQQRNSLNCVKEVSFLPSSFSLNSVELLPIEPKIEPKLCCLTLRYTSNGHVYNGDVQSSAEIRVLHASKDVKESINQILGNKEAEKQNEFPEEIKSWPFKLKHNETKMTVQGMCWILESLIQNGWEIGTSCLPSISVGYDLHSFFLKKNSAPALNNAQVAAVVIDEHEGRVEVLSHRRGEKQVDINNAVQRAVKKTQQISSPVKTRSKTSSAASGRCSSSEMAKEIETELRKSFETLVENEENHCSSNNKSKTKIPVKSFARPMFNKRARDDPKCPSEFKFESLACTEPKVAQKLLNSRLILEIAHLLFCRQWKLIAQSSVPQTAKRHVEVLFFCRDGRILPALGQQSFAMMDLEQPNILRLFNMEDGLKEALKKTLSKCQPHLEHISDAQDFTELRWKHPVWSHNLQDSESKEILLVKECLAMATICQLLMVMNRHEFNLYSTSRLATKSVNRQRSQLIFRQSNVAYSHCMCLHLSGSNKLVLIGGGTQEIEIARNVLKTRWPYPIVRDEELDLEASKSRVWVFKVKRQPWAVSYGHKHLDKAIEMAQGILHRPFPPPSNTDSDSGKSILVFLLKELSDEGWRIQGSVDIAAKNETKRSHPWSLFLMK